jgi:purine-nucleoside phosphorylase
VEAMPKLSDLTTETIAFIRSKTALKPEIALVLGSGLGGLGDSLEDQLIIPYADLPHFVKSTAPGHKGRLIIGRLGGKTLLCMQGRFHYYEGYSMADITYPVRVMAALGIKTLILTNASGGLKKEIDPGDILLISDHINFMGTNPLIGPNADDFGPRFNDMTNTYTPYLQELARKSAAKLGITLREGIYVGFTGPSYETPAEVCMAQAFGGSAVGMSTVPEAIVARHCGLDVLGLSCVTNPAAGILDKPIDENEVIEAANAAGEKFIRLLVEIIKGI